MPGSSDSEEFYDAEDVTPTHNTRKTRRPSKSGSAATLKLRANSEPNVAALDDEAKVETTSISKSNDEHTFAEPQPKPTSHHPIGGRKRFNELRRKLTTEEDDCAATNITPPNSQTSSVEGVFAAGTTTNRPSQHPFRIIEHDTVSLQSMSSLGRVGRILGGTIDVNSSEKEKARAVSVSSLDSGETCRGGGLQEPDVVASSKVGGGCVGRVAVGKTEVFEAPVAPPRRKRKKEKGVTASLSLVTSPSKSEGFSSSVLASPASTIESLTRELEHTLDHLTAKPVRLESQTSTLKSIHSLDIKQAIKGSFVVKPQDNESSKADTNTEIVETVESPSKSVKNRGSVGHYSLGSHRNFGNNPTALKERRKSAGDENMLKQLNLCVRTRTDSGKPLTDLEILEQVTVLNLDTGEQVPLSIAEEKLPQCINPLSLHIMRLTSEYVSSGDMEKAGESDEESIFGGVGSISGKKSEKTEVIDDGDSESGRVRTKTEKLKRFLGSTVKKTMHKAKSIAQEVSHARHKENVIDIIDAVHPGEQNIKLKASNSHKGPYEFEKVEHVQEIAGEHEGAIWCMKFSSCGRLLATAGQDKILRIWIIKDAFPFFQDMRTKYNAEKVSPTPSQESLVSHHSDTSGFTEYSTGRWIFMPKPFCTYTGHTSDLLDVSWSKNYFVLSSSMDKTVRLWHISRKECLCCFQHIDFVTAIAFHPRDDRYFLSGSLDGKLRLWNIPDKKVAVWNEVEGNPKLITAANFSQNGKFAVVGSYDGRCIFYSTDQLKYHTQIHVRSSRGRNATGRKISGIEPMPGEDKILVTSNDSRIRLYDLRDLIVSCKYKGCVNTSSQIKASFSHDGKYIVSGSENRDIYIWKTNHDYSKFSSVRRDRNDFWEAIKAHNAVVTCAIFAPNPDDVIKMWNEADKGDDEGACEQRIDDPMVEQHVKGCGGYVLISADFNGCIKVFLNKMKPKHSSLPASAMA